MSGNEKSDLEGALARLEEDWRKLAELLRRLAAPDAPVLEAEAFRLKDPAGRLRGELRLTAEGAASLALNDPEGRVRAQLGLSDAGDAFLTLRDRYGAIIFQVPDDLRGTGAAAQAEPALAARLEQVADDVATLRELLQGREEAPAAPTPAAEAPEAEDLPGFPARLAHLEKQVRRGRITGAATLALAFLALAGLALALNWVPRPGTPVSAPAFTLQGPGGLPLARLAATGGQARLDLLDPQGRTRVSLGLEADGGPSLKLFDQDQKLRAELNLGPEGEPSLDLRDEAGRLRAALGHVGPRNLGPEAAMTRPASSLTLFDDKGRLLWLAPRPWRP